VNTGNSCFLNSTLQSLVACPLFYQFLHCLHRALQQGFLPPACPVLRAMAQFVGELLPPGVGDTDEVLGHNW
jgi:hypothetical protein